MTFNAGKSEHLLVANSKRKEGSSQFHMKLNVVIGIDIEIDRAHTRRKRILNTYRATVQKRGKIRKVKLKNRLKTY